MSSQPCPYDLEIIRPIFLIQLAQSRLFTTYKPFLKRREEERIEKEENKKETEPLHLSHV